MVTITLYAKQKKRHICTEQTFRLCGRRRGWDVQREQHWNKYTIKGETDHQPRLDAGDKCSGLVHWEDPEGGGRGDWDWGTHVNPWLIHVNVWQNPLQYCKVISLKPIKINEKIIKCWTLKKNKILPFSYYHKFIWPWYFYNSTNIKKHNCFNLLIHSC